MGDGIEQTTAAPQIPDAKETISTFFSQVSEVEKIYIRCQGIFFTRVYVVAGHRANLFEIWHRIFEKQLEMFDARPAFPFNLEVLWKDDPFAEGYELIYDRSAAKPQSQ